MSTHFELWHGQAEHWSVLYQKGMRVLVEGRTVRDEWEDSDGPRVTFKIEARRIAILPYRLESVTLSPKSATPAASGAPGGAAS